MQEAIQERNMDVEVDADLVWCTEIHLVRRLLLDDKCTLAEENLWNLARPFYNHYCLQHGQETGSQES